MQPSVERYGKKAAEEADGNHAGHYGIGITVGQKAEYALELSGLVVVAVGEPYQQDAGGGQAEGADADQPEVQAVAAEFAAQYRACGNADGKQGKHQVVDIVVAAEVFLRKGGQLGGINRANQPKP